MVGSRLPAGVPSDRVLSLRQAPDLLVRACGGAIGGPTC